MPELLNDPLTQCPICLLPVSDYSEVRTDKPFTAYNPFEGLNAWGAYSIPKQTLCFKGGQIIHFKIGDSERLVRMLTAPEIPTCFDCGATEIADVCPECFKPFCANCVEKDESCCDK